MTITKTQENGKITLPVDGRLDTTTAPQLQNEFIPAFDDAKKSRRTSHSLPMYHRQVCAYCL